MFNTNKFFATFFNDTTIAYPLKKSVHFYIGVFLIILSGIKLYSGLQNSMDIQFADEAAYIRFGLDLFEKMNRNWGPLYAVWYKGLSVFTTNTIQLYYLNFEVTAILIAVLLYVFLLRICVNPALALVVAFSVLISDLNISVWPRISHFCVILCLVALIINTYIKKTTYKCLVFTILCLACAYARPEFYLSFVLMCIVTLISIYYYKETMGKKDIIYLSVGVIILLVLHIIFRFPSNDFFGYDRGVAAFYQHYAWNYKWRTHGTFDAWLYWEDLAKKQFGDCNSIWCVIKTQPGIFFGNILFNIRTYFMQLIKTVPFVFPVSMVHGNKLRLIVTFGILLAFILLLIIRPSRHFFIQRIKQLRFNLVLLFCFIAPTLLSCFVIFPRDHYVYLQMIFFLLIYLSAFEFLFKQYQPRIEVFMIIGLLFTLNAPNISGYNFMKTSNDTHSLCNKKLVTFLQENYGDKPHVLFTNMPFVRGMLTTNFKEVNTIFDKKKQIPFQHYLDSAKIDIVIVIPSLLRDPHVNTDTTWINFMDHYSAQGFERKNFTDCDMYLLTKSALGNQQ